MARKLPAIPIDAGRTSPAGGAAPRPDGGKSGSPVGFLFLWFGIPLVLVLVAQ